MQQIQEIVQIVDTSSTLSEHSCDTMQNLRTLNKHFDSISSIEEGEMWGQTCYSKT